MIDEKNIEKTKVAIKKEKHPVFVKAQGDEYNRKIIEYGKFNCIFGLDSNIRKRTLRNIDSGFNSVFGKIATKNNIRIGIDLSELRGLERKQKAERIIQIMQNINIAKKTKTNAFLIGVKDKRDASSFLRSIGASTAQTSKSLHF